ncbi:hypothetical protein [Ornithobacterium rhinotracheale]
MKKLNNGLYAIGSTLAVTDTFKKAQIPMNEENAIDDISPWGDDNLYPQEFLRKFEKTDAAIGGVEVLTTAHYGNGFKLYQEVETEKGVDTRERSVNAFPEIKDFFKRTKWNLFMAGLITDYEIFRLAFPEFLLSPDGNKIISVKRHQAAWCRFGAPDKKKFFVDKVFINSNWEEYNEAMNVKVPMIPEVGASVEEIKQYAKEKKLTRFIIPVSTLKTSEKLYPRVGWHSAFNNGWTETVLSVPEFKKYMFANQLHFKYVVYISDEFMTRKYGRQAWDDMSTEEKEKKRDEVVNTIDEHMSGNEAAGRSLISPYFKDMNGNLMHGIEIVPIDDKIKDGNFLPDAAAGNSQILFAMGVDPSLIGAGIPGGKNLSGSGSDKREAYTILCSKMPFKRMHLLEVFNFIRDFNGWDETLIGNFPNLNLTTLDKNPSGQTEVVN